MMLFIFLAFYTGMDASNVLGQVDFYSTLHSTTDSTFYHPNSITFWKGYLCVSDKLNNRVLLFQNGSKKADFVFGQADFHSYSDNIISDSTLNQPMGVSADSNLFYVADYGNNRVLIYNDSTGKADIVIGQQDMSTNAANTSQDGLRAPTDVCSDNKHLFIADRGNNRVLVYNSIPTNSGAPADYVIGHLDFDDGSLLPPSDSTLYYPYSIFSDGNHLFIADKFRILIYDSIPHKNNAKADIIISGEGSASDSTFSGIGDLYWDGNNLFLADYGYNRILILPNPFSNNKANVVIGQMNFTDSLPNQGGNAGRATLFHPSGVFLKDSSLYVADTYNNRIMVWKNSQGIYQTEGRKSDIVNGNIFFMRKSSPVYMRLYDVSGRMVENIFLGNLSKGYHHFPKIKNNHPSGIYFMLVSGKNLSISKKIILLK